MLFQKYLSLFFLSFLLFPVVEAGTTREVFAKYPNKYFIETGSCTGDGIQKALEAGFEHIISIELAPHYYRHCCQRFASFSNVAMLLGDSTEILPLLLQTIEAPATFWLDGHYSEWDTARGESNTPLMAELESIRQHRIKTHTLMIDDARLFGAVEFDFLTLDEVIKKIKEINTRYVISFEDGHIPNDVLIAQVR